MNPPFHNDEKMTRPELVFRQAESHLDLVARVPHYRQTANIDRVELSGVVIPTRRAPGLAGDGLGIAARCAQAHDAQLIVIRSGPARRERFPAALAPISSSRTLVVDLPDDYTGVLPEFRSDRHPVASLHRDVDTGRKRNLGLAIGALCGWSSLLLLDDDVSTWPASTAIPPSAAAPVEPSLRLDDVRADFAHYPGLRAAGFILTNFNDNSVVCHTRRLLSQPQGLFLSAGTMVVRCGTDVPFFPSAYNQDWLFLLALMLDAKHIQPSSAIKLVGAMHQAPYYPFDPARARSEELGDVLADGVYNLLGDPAHEILARASSAEHWRQAIWRRQRMILHLLHHIQGQLTEPNAGPLFDANAALRAALAVYSEVEDPASLLAEYIRRWIHDQQIWRQFLSGITPAETNGSLTVPEALDILDLSQHARWI